MVRLCLIYPPEMAGTAEGLFTSADINVLRQEEMVMTTINTSVSAVQSGSTGSKAATGNDLSAQISRITQQITKLTQQLKEVADGSGSTEEKQKQQELIQTQIKMLQAQLAQLQRQQAEETQQKQEQKQLRAEGVNAPSDDHQIDVYI